MSNRKVLGVLAGLMLFITPANAAMSHPNPAQRFAPVAQPVTLKVGVTIGGLALIGLELWWFLGRRTKPGDRA